MGEVEVLAALQVEDPDAGWSAEPDASFIHPAPQAAVDASTDGDGLAVCSGNSQCEEFTKAVVPVSHVLHEGAQQRLALAGAVVHAFLDASFADPVAAGVGVGDRAGRHPDRPLLGFRSGPRLQIGVEGADRPQDGVKVAASLAVGSDCDLVTPLLVEPGVDAQVRLAGGEPLDGSPEVAGQVPGQVVQRRVVQLRFSAFQVSDKQVPDPGMADLVAVDQLLDGQPPVQQRGL